MTGATLLRQARLRAGLSRSELARRAGKAPSAIGRWERGEVDPSFEMLQHLIRSAGFDLSVSVVPRNDHDLVLIRRCLAETPEQRLHSLIGATRAFNAMVEAANG